MRYEAYTRTWIAVAAAVSGLGAGCAGGARPTEGDPPGAQAKLEPSSSDSEETTTERRAPLKQRFRDRAIQHLQTKGSGYAQFSQCSDGKSCSGPLAEMQFYAQFSPAETGVDAGPSPCTTTTSGSCALTTCTGYSASEPGVSAGALTVGGGDIGSVKIWTNAFQGFLYSMVQVGAAWSAGDTLTLSGSGGKVPAFAAESLTAPGGITLTSPVANAKGQYAIATSAPLALTWTGGAAGNSVFVEVQAETATGVSYFSCGWPATAGKGSVPTAMLTPFAGQKADISWGQQAPPVRFRAGGFATDLFADWSGSAPASFE